MKETTPTKKTVAKKTVAKTAAPKSVVAKVPKEKKAVAELSAPIYSQSAKAAGTIALPGSVFGLKWNGDLVHQVVVGMQANMRAGTAHTKDRSEVRGGGKKPWKQKGTGRARHGSNRSPIWVGGGVTFGPRNDKDYSQKINKKMRVKALYTVLSKKFADSAILFVDTLSLDAIKTKDASSVLSTLASIAGFEKLTTKKKTGVLIVLPETNDTLALSFANLPGVTLTTAVALNALVVATFHAIVVVNPSDAVAVLEAKMK
ncbi:MAG TPA: 50S ribosomal protein L4 [Candidatus Paceibacterota bacterium]